MGSVEEEERWGSRARRGARGNQCLETQQWMGLSQRGESSPVTTGQRG